MSAQFDVAAPDAEEPVRRDERHTHDTPGIFGGIVGMALVTADRFLRIGRG